MNAPTLTRLSCTLALLAAAATAPPVHAQGGAPAAQDGVRVQLFVDQRRIAEARKKIDPDDFFPVYAYKLQPGPQALELRIDSPELMRRWKGDFVLGQDTKATFEDTTQFLPVLLVLDVSNESATPLQVTNAYLEMQSSRSDLQPFITLYGWMQDAFSIINYGWGRAENARLDFGFGRERPVTDSFALALGALGAVEVTPVRAVTAVVPNVQRLLDEPPKCPSNRQVPACLARLQRAPGHGPHRRHCLHPRRHGADAADRHAALPVEGHRRPHAAARTPGERGAAAVPLRHRRRRRDGRRVRPRKPASSRSRCSWTARTTGCRCPIARGWARGRTSASS